MEREERTLARQRLIERLQALADWKNNDVVKLGFLGEENLEQVDGMDLTGVVELKRNANGTFEVKFVDKVRVLAMLRELMDEDSGDALGELMDTLRQGDGDEA